MFIPYMADLRENLTSSSIVQFVDDTPVMGLSYKEADYKKEY